NRAPHNLYRGALDFGGGADVKFWRRIGLRGEIRDFYSGSPAYSTPGVTGGQHNVVAGGGFVLKRGKEPRWPEFPSGAITCATLVAVSLGIRCAVNKGGHDEALLDRPAGISLCLESYIGGTE